MSPTILDAAQCFPYDISSARAGLGLLALETGYHGKTGSVEGGVAGIHLNIISLRNTLKC